MGSKNQSPFLYFFIASRFSFVNGPLHTISDDPYLGLQNPIFIFVSPHRLYISLRIKINYESKIYCQLTCLLHSLVVLIIFSKSKLRSVFLASHFLLPIGLYILFSRILIYNSKTQIWFPSLFFLRSLSFFFVNWPLNLISEKPNSDFHLWFPIFLSLHF
jgi:hypothetical protein